MTNTETTGTGTRPLPQPEPGLRPQDVIDRAEAMIPMLRAQQDEADERGHFSTAVLDQFRAAGFYRMVQPKLFGGYEFDNVTFFEVVYRISAGHPSSGWCFCLSATHVSVICSFLSAEAQQELLGPDGEFRSPHRAVPGGEIREVEGGYRVSGTWRFSSGIPISTHFLGNSLLQRDGTEPKNVAFVVPREQVTVLDDWGNGAALGMQGSGSNAVRIDDVFVPADHIIHDDILFGTTTDFNEGTPGTRLHGNPRYLGLFDPIYHLSFGAVLAGTARAAVERLRELMPVTKRILGEGTMAADPDAVRAIGRCAALADASHSVMRETAARMDALLARWARNRAPIAPGELMRLHALARQGALLGAEAAQLAFQAGSARASGRSEPLQRYLRDAQMYLVHASSQPMIDEARGQAELGQPLTMVRRR
ncbi:acyl-CoA dehydrogenase family protein [Nocardia sp. CA-120079]|uniref:acyl-CoA dehydrogenase family protein n=1 Tax=Nocardia sp. CA-120079 TaxID=3239974 RepID=UPI003D96FDF6